MEKRNARRFETDTPISCGVFNSDQSYDARLVNYSQDGICFKCNAAFRERCSLLLRINGAISIRSTSGDPDGPRTISLAEVRWLEEVTDGKECYFTIGAKYYPHY